MENIIILVLLIIFISLQVYVVSGVGRCKPWNYIDEVELYEDED